MGCFSTCFRKSNQRKHRRRSVKARSRLGQVLQVDDDVEVLQIQVSEEEAIIVKTIDESQPEEILEAPKAKLNISGRKKVTFDLNVKIYESDGIDETEYEPATGNGDGEESEKKQDVTTAAAPKDGHCNSDSSSSSLFSYPPNYRYQNCRDSDDEIGSEESDIDDYSSDGDNEDEEEDDEVVESEIKTNGGNASGVKEESSESLFSLSLDSRKHKLRSEGDKEVNSPMPIKKSQLGNNDSMTKEFNLEDSLDHTNNFDSVLNPVENLTQWKAVKARSKLVSKQQQPEAKENMVFKDQEITQPIPELEPNHHLNPSMQIQKEVRHKRQEVVAVDTSLSSWLGGSESTTHTPNGKKTGSVSIGNSPSSAAAASSSPISFDDRPILGALTMEEIKEFSAKSSPRRSPSPSPDDIPIIGTVGSYWSHTGHQNSYSGYGSHCKRNSNIKNKSREGSRIKSINSTPFAKRLERASQMATAPQTQY